MTADEIKGIGFLLAVGGGLIWNAIHKHGKARKIEDTPRSKLASAPQGYIEVQGFAWPLKSAMFDGIGGFKSVFYSFNLQMQVTEGHGKNKRRVWRTVYSKSHTPPFYILDGTGLALLEPTGAEVSIESSKTQSWQRVEKGEQTRILEKVISEKIPHFPPSNFLFGLFSKKFRTVETEIPVGSPLYVHGDFNSSADGVTVTQEEGLTRFSDRVYDSKRREIKNLAALLDKNKDGNVDSKEARSGYQMAAKLAFSKAKIEPTVEKEFSLFGRIGSSETHKLFIGDAHEEHIVKRLRKWIWVQFSAGAVVTSFGIFTLLQPIMGQSKGKSEKTSQRAIAEAQQEKEINSINGQISAWHEQCVSGLGHSCQVLLERSEKMGVTLSLDQKAYYHFVACSKGMLQHCPTK